MTAKVNKKAESAKLSARFLNGIINGGNLSVFFFPDMFLVFCQLSLSDVCETIVLVVL